MTNNTDDSRIDVVDYKCKEFIDEASKELNDLGYSGSRIDMTVNLNKSEAVKMTEKVDVQQTILFSLPWIGFMLLLMWVMVTMVEASKIITNESNQAIYLIVMLFVVMRLISMIGEPVVKSKRVVEKEEDKLD